MIEKSPEGAENTMTNVLQEHHDVLTSILEPGLAHHTCGLFHDQMILVTDLEKAGIQARTRPTSTGYAYPMFCDDQSSKMGCAHAGFREKTFGDASRSIDAPTRTQLSNAIRSLAKHAPDLLPQEKANTLLNRIEALGVKIAKLDTEMRVRPTEASKEHTACVTELFHIAEEMDVLLQKAVEQGRGVVTFEESDIEHQDPHDPDGIFSYT